MATLVTEGTRGPLTWLRRDAVARGDVWQHPHAISAFAGDRGDMGAHLDASAMTKLVAEGTHSPIVSPWAHPDAVTLVMLVTEETYGHILSPEHVLTLSSWPRW